MTENFVKYKRGYKYHLLEDAQVITPILGYDVETDWIKLTPNGVLIIRKGYASDGPSGPTFDTKTFIRAAFAHDALYQLIREMLLPPAEKISADSFLHDLCVLDGMHPIRALWIFAGVSLFGSKFIDTFSGKEILTAP